MSDITTWRKEIEKAMLSNGEAWADVVACTLSEEGLDVEFDDGYGGTEGAAFTLWTKAFVYFPICYDGSEWVGHAPRNPNGVAMHHQGGG